MMYYSPSKKYLWDFWIATSNKEYHLFYLQANRNLPTPDERHKFASIGHAISADLYQWSEMGTVLEKGPKGEWDDTSLWTGSIIKKNDLFYMFYTSRSSQEKGRIQRIGLAISEDLHHWEKYKGNPIITANPQWYETCQISEDGLEHWRDPYVIYHAREGMYYAFICAKVNYGESQGRGCIARAKSKDLLCWEVIGPATRSGNFMQMEVPDVHIHDDDCYLIFSVDNLWYSKKHLEEIKPRQPQTGAHYYHSKNLSGIFSPIPKHEVLLGSETNSYGTRIFKTFQGELTSLSWKTRKKGLGDFAGCLDHPRRVNYLPGGALKLA
jgi:beta-fructofuranosidase